MPKKKQKQVVPYLPDDAERVLDLITVFILVAENGTPSGPVFPLNDAEKARDLIAMGLLRRVGTKLEFTAYGKKLLRVWVERLEKLRPGEWEEIIKTPAQCRMFLLGDMTRPTVQ